MVLWLCPPLTAPSRHIVPIKTSRRSSAADEKKNLGDKMRPGGLEGRLERERENEANAAQWRSSQSDWYRTYRWYQWYLTYRLKGSRTGPYHVKALRA